MDDDIEFMTTDELKDKSLSYDQQLVDRINKFLETTAFSNGGYAAVDKTDIQDLHEIVSLILSLKYETDSDGVSPIHVLLVDKTKYQTINQFPISRLDNLKTPEDFLHAISLAQSNVSICSEQLRSIITMLQYSRPQKFYTDYPIVELGDKEGEKAPIRECYILEYDGNKYCAVDVERVRTTIKSGYIYTKIGRKDEVPCISSSQLRNYLR